MRSHTQSTPKKLFYSNLSVVARRDLRSALERARKAIRFTPTERFLGWKVYPQQYSMVANERELSAIRPKWRLAMSSLSPGHIRLKCWANHQRTHSVSATQLGIGTDWFKAILGGKMPSTKVLRRIYEVTGITPNEFFGLPAHSNAKRSKQAEEE